MKRASKRTRAEAAVVKAAMRWHVARSFQKGAYTALGYIDALVRLEDACASLAAPRRRKR